MLQRAAAFFLQLLLLFFLSSSFLLFFPLFLSWPNLPDKLSWQRASLLAHSLKQDISS